MNSTFRIALMLGGALLATSTYSAESEYLSISELQERAQKLDLANAVQWRRLVHYYPSSRSATGIESHVDDERYFLASTGKLDPQAELLATIAALFKTRDQLTERNSSEDLSPRCRFVARELWLREALGLDAQSVPQQCTQFHEWMQRVKPHTVTLIFPASFLNSPSSMFGHTLLRIDPKDVDDKSEWLSWSLNFAADVGEDDSLTAGYAFKGIAGAYDGKFHSVPYFQKLQEYGAIENRDIWEYTLDLTPEEVKRLVMHAWELNDISFDYYFFRQNCSFRLLELIDWARPSLSLTDQFPMTTIPADTVKSVVNANIVSNTAYRPSLGAQLQQALLEVPTEHRRWVSAIENDPSLIDDTVFASIAEDKQARIITAANDLLTYRSRKTVRTPEIAERRLSLLKHISQIKNFSKPVPAKPNAPETAHPTRLLSLGFGQREDREFTDLSFRISYHDILDRQAGYLRGAGITLGNLTVRRDNDGDARVQEFALVKLQSISDRVREFDSLSWTLQFGLVRDTLIADDSLGARLRGSVGKSVPLASNTIAYAMAGPSVNAVTSDTETFFNLHANAGLLWYPTWGSHQFDLSVDSIESRSARFSAALTSNLDITANQAIRFKAIHENVDAVNISTVSLAYRFYF